MCMCMYYMCHSINLLHAVILISDYQTSIPSQGVCGWGYILKIQVIQMHTYMQPN